MALVTAGNHTLNLDFPIDRERLPNGMRVVMASGLCVTRQGGERAAGP